MVRHSPIQGNSHVDWIGSDVLAIALHNYAWRSRCVVKMKNTEQCFRYTRLKTPFAEKYCSFVQIFTKCVFKSCEGAVLGSQADIISVEERPGVLDFRVGLSGYFIPFPIYPVVKNFRLLWVFRNEV